MVSSWVLIIYLSGGMMGDRPLANPHGGVTAINMNNKDSCIYALNAIRKQDILINGFCIPR